MTWKEFKEGIDKKLVAENISEDTPIEYIDISHPPKNAIEDDRVYILVDSQGIGIAQHS